MRYYFIQNTKVSKRIPLAIFLFLMVYAVFALGNSFADQVSVEELTGEVEPGEIQETTEQVSAPIAMAALALSDSGASNNGPQSAVNTIHVDPTSGAGMLSLPIIAPPGRNGVAPSLSLNYSMRNGNGPLGVGWTMGFGNVERSTKNGVPQYDDTDTFILNLGGSAMELVDVGDGDYRIKVEGAFFYIHYDGNTWIVKDKRGTTYYFGLATEHADLSKDIVGSGKVFRWKLSKVKDILGNFYIIKYLDNESFEVYWTGEPGTDTDGVNSSSQNFYSKVIAELEETERSDKVLDYRSGGEYQLSMRIKSLSVFAEEELYRRYDFRYEYSERTGRSLLKGITEFGIDGSSSLPEIEFIYQEQSPSYEKVSIVEDPTQGDNLWSFRYNGGYDYGSDCYGAVPPGALLPLSDAITTESWDGAGSWSQDGHGRISLNGRQDTGYYFSTYLYTTQSKTLNIQMSAADTDVGLWLNGEYSNRTVKLNWSFDLKPGYNLLEYTDYNQNQGFWINFLTTLDDKVDMMSSVQVVVPQLAGDFNGDGLTDVASFFQETGKVKVALSQGNVFLPKETWLEGLDDDIQILIGDYNADGKTDIGTFSSDDGVWMVYDSDGTAFINAHVMISDFGNGYSPGVGDLNGDGYVDAAYFYRNDSELEMRVAINEGGQSFRIIERIHSISKETAQGFLADINGDGLADYCAFSSERGSFYFRLNQGGADQPLREEFHFCDFARYKEMSVADINHDGMADMGYFDSSTGKGYFYLSKGTFFDETKVIETPITFDVYGSATRLQTADMNGDGLLDFVVYNQTGNLEIAYSSGQSPDLLKEVNNGIGGKTQIEYQPSTYYSNHYLPFVLPMVSKVTVGNSRDYEVMTQYWYDGGLWEADEKEFYGFETVRTYDIGGKYTETIFSQEDIYERGRPLVQQSFKADGTLIKKSIYILSTRQVLPDDVPDVKFCFVSEQDDLIYDELGQDGKRSRKFFSYSEYGDQTKVFQLVDCFDFASGEFVSITHYRLDTMDYFNNDDNDVYIIGLPKLKNSIGRPNISQETYFYYDGASSGDALPVKGLLTRKEVVDDDSDTENITEDYVYDTYGNTIEVIDLNRNSSKIFYDNEYNLFPVSAQNALGHSTCSNYYGIGSIGLVDSNGLTGNFGQLYSATDVNNISSYYSYDEFGRIKSEIGPDDSVEFPTLTYEYDVFSNYSRLVSHRRVEHGESKTIDAAQFYDGLGNLLESKIYFDDGVNIAFGWKVYDSFGRISREYLAAEVSTSLTTLDDIAVGTPYTLYQYDDRGRVESVTNPDGTFKTVDYGLLEVEKINENGHKVKEYFDWFGRMIKKEEFLGADGRCSVYSQEPYELYATTNYEYNRRDQLTKTIDAHGNETIIAYDGFGRKVYIDDPDMGLWKYNYDTNGNLVWQRDARWQELFFEYDALNRLTRKYDNEGIDVVYTYDDEEDSFGKGKLSQVDYGPGQDGDITHFYYDKYGRETRSQKTIDNFGYEVRRSYNAFGQLESVTYPDGTSVYYTYDDTGRLIGVANNQVLLEEPEDPLSFYQEGFWDKLKNGAGYVFSEWIEPFVFGVKPVFAQETSRQAELILPESGALLDTSTVHFEWDPGEGVEYHYLFIGTSLGSGNIYASSVTGRTSQDVSGIFLDGSLVYVRLWSYIDGLWQYLDYQFQTADTGERPSPSELVSPERGFVIESKPVEFQWNEGIGVKYNYVMVGSSQGAATYFSKMFLNGETSVSIDSMLLDGNIIYVRLWSYIYSKWSYKDYSFETVDNGEEIVISKMIFPKTSDVIDADEVKFRWEEGQGVSANYIYIGTSAGRYDVYNKGFYSGQTSDTVSDIPLTGENLYVRLWSRTYLRWEFEDYVYQTDKPHAEPEITVSAESISAQTGDLLEFRIVASDSDGDNLELSAPLQDVLPNGAMIDIQQQSAGYLEAVVQWRPQYYQSGDYNIIFAVTDGEFTSRKTVSLSIEQGEVGEPDRTYISNIDYNIFGQTKMIEYGNGTVTEYSFNDRNMRLEQLVTTRADGEILQDLTYTYDAVGNIISIDDAVNTATQVFEYDSIGRLVYAQNDEGYGAKFYVYDEVGNILEKDGKGFVYDESGRRPHAVTSLDDGSYFRYDANGNMTRHKIGDGSNDCYDYQWDSESRLEKVYKNANELTRFAYDGDGGRVKKIMPNAVGGGTGLAFPELLGDASQEDLVTHYVGSLYERSTTGEAKHIFIGDQRAISVVDGNVKFVLNDHLGSPNIITDEEGNVKELNEYEPFGSFSRQERQGEEEYNIDKYFTQQILDDETGLYYYGARYYDPLIGRFISPDSIVQAPMDPQTLNRYSYCRNNPVLFIDPSGHFFGIDDIIVGAIIGAVIGGISSGIQTDWNWEAVGTGALTGAVGGVVFTGVSSAFTSFAKFAMTGTANMSFVGGAATTVNVLGSIVGGAGSGAAVAGYLGGDPLQGAGYGALSGGVFGSISAMPGTGWVGAGRVALAGLAGGGMSELGGGSFWNGFTFAGSIAGADFVYRSIIAMENYKYGASLETAEYDGDAKLDGCGNPFKVIHDPIDKKSNVGYRSEAGASGFFDETGAPMSWIGKNVPGVNGTSYFHDIITQRFEKTFGKVANGVFFNVPSMVPSFGITTVGSAMNDMPALIGTYEIYGD